jgi:N-acetyl-anhydromuramoyl-L-alanine amidase
MTRPEARPLWQAGWHRDHRHCPSPNIGPRPPSSVIDLAIVHSISLPPGQYGGDEIEQLFTNRLDPAAHPYFEQLRGLEVSAHFLVRRDGTCVQFASVDDRAWHAGRSHWRGRDNCNDWSVGIELEGLEGDRFEAAQYTALAGLLRDLARAWPLAEVVGHEDVAPGRKQDPGPGFDWTALAQALHHAMPHGTRPRLPRLPQKRKMKSPDLDLNK